MNKKVGVIGVGRWGVNHAKIYKELHSELVDFVGLSDTDPSKESIANHFGVTFFHNYKDLIKEVDAISIVVPTNRHYQIVKECLFENVNVLVEKPFVLDSREAEELVKLAKEKNLILHVGYIFRFNPVTVELKKLLHEIGEIRSINARYIQPNNPRSDSGVIFNLSVHLIDILNFILAERPATVLCKMTNIFHPNLEDTATITLGYGKFHATFELSCVHPEKRRDMFILGTKGAFYADFKEQILISYKPQKVGNEWHKEAIHIEKKEPLKEEIINFVNSMGDDEMRKLGEEEIYTTKICEKALDSAKLGRELRI